MENIYKQLSIVLLTTLCLISCTENINVAVPNGGNRLIVEASMDWKKGTTGQNQRIKLSTSKAYFDTSPNTPVIEASVKVTKNDTGTEFIFQDQGNGIYTTTNFVPELNKSYSLQIIHNGKTYAATETMTPVVDISNVEQTISSNSNNSNTQVTIYFDDPANESNYYLGEFITPIEPLASWDPLSDNFTNGNQNSMEYENESFVVGTTINVNLYGISKRYYNYFNLLLTQSEGAGSVFQTTPVRLKGNCKNIADPNEEVLGYFKLSEVATTSYVIQ